MMTPEDHIAKAEELLEQAGKDLNSQLYDRAKVKAEIAAGHAQIAAAWAAAEGLDFRRRR